MAADRMRTPFKLAEPVRQALAAGRPVVALESAVVSHGLPHPVSLDAAARLEAAVRAAGAVPATVAVLAGELVVGASPEELARLVEPGAVKLAARDLPAAVVRRLTGGTTVSATLAAAEGAGIAVLATGGIGGVHLGAEVTGDVSPDLVELSRRAVAVVCSGAKAVCDAGRTLEYLETLGVPVVGVGTGRFPCFYAADSGYAVPFTASGPDEVARWIRALRRLGERRGLLVVHPVPARAALDPGTVRAAVGQARREAEARGVAGKDLTPYLLAALNRLTAGKTLETNLALLEANAALAGRIATALAG